MLPVIRLKIGSIHPFLGVLGILKSDAWFGTDTSFAHAIIIFLIGHFHDGVILLQLP